MISPVRSRMDSMHTAAAAKVEALCYWLAERTASLAVALLKPRNTISTYELTDDEAEAQGVPYVYELPNVVVSRMAGRALWKVGVWLDEGDRPTERCLNIKVFGHAIEVYHMPKARHPSAAAA